MGTLAPDDFAEMFDFDGFDSVSGLHPFFETWTDGDQSHSPSTLSPNRTPSPLVMTGASPFALSPSFDFSTLDPPSMNSMNFDFEYPMIEKSLPDISIKQEPLEFGFTQPIATQEPDIPSEQAAALQQLLANMVNYQAQYGEANSMAMNGTNATAGPSGTIEPSLLFGTTSTIPSGHVSPTISLPSLIHEASPPPQDIPRRESIDVDGHSDEELLSISPLETKPNPNVNLEAALANLTPLPEIFSAGRGKGGKKGGGLSSVVKGDDEDLDDDDSWRPTPEEYKKLSSKEKRQLRNKLSARAFRTRRKDYIGTLESHIKDRDGVIDAIKAELGNSRSENQDLRCVI
jgi:hypothetical protein